MSAAASSRGRSRRTALVAAVAGSAAALAAGLPASVPAGPVAEPPNVVLIMTDDQRADDMRALRRTVLRMAGYGASFPNSFVNYPLCCPARATLLTGQFAHNHGVLSNVPPDGGVTAFDDSQSIAVALDEAGYRTGWIGKYLNGYPELGRADPPYIPPGWDEWFATVVPDRMYGWVQLIRGEEVRWRGDDPAKYQTDVVARQAGRFVQRNSFRAEPFFLTVGVFAPHGERRSGFAADNPRPAERHAGAFDGEPLPPSPSFNEEDVSDKPSFVQNLPELTPETEQRFRDRHRDRLASLLAVDDLVARVLNALRDTGELKNTLVIFTSDNGFLLGEHRMFRKRVLYDEALRVPLLVRGPGIPPAVRPAAPVVNADIPATIYDATGVEPLVPQDGISLYDVIANPNAYDERDILIYLRNAWGIRNQRYMYAEHQAGDETEYELYDMASDPFQLTSVHDEPGMQGVRAALAKRLDELRGCVGSGCH